MQHRSLRVHPGSMRETYRHNRATTNDSFNNNDEEDAVTTPRSRAAYVYNNKRLSCIKPSGSQQHRKKSVSLLTSMKEREKAIRSMQIPVLSHVPINFEKIRRTEDGKIKVANYIVTGLIGEGNGGRVYLAEEQRSRSKAAIKVIDKIDEKCLRKAVKEAGAMSQVGPHENIVDLLGIVENEDCVCLIMQYAEGGDLFEYIKRNRGVQREEAWRMFEQLVEVVARIHDQGFIHRDIKPENIFLDEHNNVLLGDWGYAAPWSLQHKKQRPCGSLNYAATEILTNTKYYGPEIDMFALGGVLYTMLTGKLPFGYAKNKETFERVLTGAWRKDGSLEDLEIDLLNRLFAPNPLDRATMADVKEVLALRKAAAAYLQSVSSSSADVPGISVPGRSSSISIALPNSARASTSCSPRTQPMSPAKSASLDSRKPSARSPPHSPTASPPDSPISESEKHAKPKGFFGGLKVFSRRRRLDFRTSSPGRD